MKASTRTIHQRLASLGESMGFEVQLEHELEQSPAALRIEDSYEPRADLVWHLPLTQAQAKALAWAHGGPTRRYERLPIVGIEVEGSQPSTKLMSSDIANLAALGTPLGLLVVSEAGEERIYSRAVRAVRTMKRAYGDRRVVPLEASWIAKLEKRSWDRTPHALSQGKATKPSGGEVHAWSATTRKSIRARGEAAGFTVVEPWNPPGHTAAFELETQNRGAPPRQTIDPVKFRDEAMRKAGDFLTESKLDLAWTLPLPRSLSEMIQAIASLDPNLQIEGFLDATRYDRVAVMGFELEWTTGKHAGGGLLSLGAHCIMGTVVVPNDDSRQTIDATLARYRPTLGLHNVRVQTMK